MKISIYKPLSLAVGCLALIGCGDDDSPNTPDAKSVDAKPVDAGPFVEMPNFPLSAPDGGEIRIENLIFPDGISRTLTTAYFLKAQAGDPTPQPFPNVVDNDVLNCNTFNDHIYPFGDASSTVGAPATYGVEGREYMDVGDKITLQDKDGATPAFDLIGYQNFVTPFLGGSFHEFTYNPDTAAGDPFLAVPAERMGGKGDNLTGHKLKVTIPGGPDATARVFDFEGDFAGIEIPPRPVISDFSKLGVPSEMDISKSQPFTRSWTIPEGTSPGLLSFVAVFNTTGSVYLTNLCITAKPGKITISPEDLATFPPTGIMFIAHLFHRTRTFDNVRRIDMVGTACTATQFTITN